MKKTVLAVGISMLCGNVYADDSITQIDEILVTAEKIEKTPYEVNGTINVITDQDMKKEGATELYDTLKNIPGVSVSGGAGRPQNITIRGIKGNRVKILVDGVETSDGYGASDINDKVGRNSFDLSSVKQIEVVKGSGSSLYGSGALGGMVIVTTKEAADYLTADKDTVFDVGTNYVGESNKIRGTVGIAQRIGNTEHLLRYNQWQGNGSDNYHHSVYDRDIEGFDISLISNFYIGDHQEIVTQIKHYDDVMDRNDQLGFANGDFREQTKTVSNKYQLIYRYNDANFILFDDAEIIAYQSESKNINGKLYKKLKKSSGITEKHYHYDNADFIEKKYGIKTQFKRQLNTQDIVWGIDASQKKHSRKIEKQQYVNGTITTDKTNPFANVNTNQIGIYIHDDIYIGNWEFGAGLRYDYQKMAPEDKTLFAQSGINGIPELQSMNSSALSPSLSADYNFTPQLKSYLSYNRGFNAPSYSKAYGYVPHDGVPPFDILPNYDLKPETSDNFELGIKGNYARFLFNGAIFYSKYQDFIRPINSKFNTETGRMEKRFSNIDQASSYGIELGTTVLLTNTFSASADLAVVTAKDDDKQYLTTSTPWEGSVSLDYSDGFDAFVRLNFAAGMNKVPLCGDGNSESKCANTSGWSTVDLGMSYEPVRDLHINANINNLFNRDYTVYQDIAGISDANEFYNSQDGRNVNISLNYQF